MQNSTKSAKWQEFFAAANGYSGFRSYFPSVFNSLDFTRIFILKGGPGTGKSSLLRKLLSFGEEFGFSCQSVLCSSDPHSLDGVILEKDGYRFAALDGTSPHTRDAEIPGAVDEIINLGENWDTEKLISEKKLVLTLAKKKSENYKKAYEKLSHAGQVKSVIKAIERESINYKTLENDAKVLAESLIKEEARGRETVKLDESFGRFGIFKIDGTDAISKKTINVTHSGEASVLFMNLLLKKLREASVLITVFPSVFDDNEIRTIYLESSGTAVTVSDSKSGDVNLEKYLGRGRNDSLLSSLYNTQALLIKDAQKYFSFASDLHFELEKIYINAMNFKENDKFFEKITEKIKKSAN